MLRLKHVLATTAGLMLLGTPSLSVILDPKLCNQKQGCYHNQSNLCDVSHSKPISCNHLLKDEHARCEVMWIDPKECYIEAPYSLLTSENMPFNLRMYFSNTWMEERGAFNLTFPKPTWQSLKFQYQRKDLNRTLCRSFSLSNVSAPILDTLMWDCPFFLDPGYSGNDFELSIITDEGEGGRFTFKVPYKKHIDPRSTELKDWHVFFFMHNDHIVRSAFLPVTVQAAPFENISYNISLVKCLDAGLKCLHRSKIVSHVIQVPTGSALFTELLPSWSNPAVYAVTVQIVSPECPKDGCYVSISPTFEVKESQLWFWIGIVFAFVVIFAVAFIITHHHRNQENKKLLATLKENPPRVLLIYLPENNACLELVKSFADFLKETCYIQPYVVDTDVGTKNPNHWTSEHMNKADRLLFMVPGNLNGESVTPIRDQWPFALQYLSGHYFITHHIQSKVATVLLPFSNDVPFQIASVKRFYLVREMNSIITWIHNGTWLDSKLLWGPLLEASHKSSSSEFTLQNAIKKASECTKCYKQVCIPLALHNRKLDTSIGVTVDDHKTHPQYSGQNVSESSSNKDTDDTSIACGDEDPYDPDIHCVDTLLGEERSEGSQNSSHNLSDDADSDVLDDDAFL